MLEAEFLNVVALGLFVGLVHALDADHVIAMSSFANTSTKISHILRYASKWGLGHGGMLLFLSALLVFIGLKLPNWLVYCSELAVGLLLIYLGIRLLRTVAHRSFDLTKSRLAEHDHTPLFIGMLHGVAGSAPVLALLPSMLQTQFLQHVGLFSLGCMLGMSSFGFMLALVQTRYIQSSVRLRSRFTYGMGFMSVGFGGYWLLGA
ncbi:hypothetical protein [Catenovulum agarivorans]|uniref:hypothetical protein n=1 Tax=Catenovulum agarivorans TaxID=1172192 RepID=UPI00031C6A71|nr:hypothetical protein [Catenovulum agarivorans]